MNKKQRRARAADLLVKLESLRDEWEKEASAEQIGPQDKEKSRRERLKTIEAEIAVVRLMQSEDRLIIQLTVGALSFLGGAAMTLLFKLV